MKTKVITVVLFKNRHKIPGDPDPIYKDFDFNKFEPIPAESPVKGKNMVEYLLDQFDIRESLYLYVYVTGLTPGLTDFIPQATSKANANKNHKLVFLHYNKKTKKYEKKEATKSTKK